MDCAQGILDRDDAANLESVCRDRFQQRVRFSPPIIPLLLRVAGPNLFSMPGSLPMPG